jgi:serine/threonine protein kinase
MEWFSAPNLKRWILQGIDKIAYLVPKIVDQAAEGLAYFNQCGWVHRDIKPDNFLVSDSGDVKLIDFALARRSKSGLGKALTPKSKVQGTRSYMSPEQIRGVALDQRADVYSFGCLLYEMFAGRPPFTGSTADDLLRKHLFSPPPSLEVVDKNITPEFAELVRRSLAKDPKKRPESVNEFRISKVFKTTPRPPDEIVGGRQ